MELAEFASVVETMILEHDYPGFEPRSLRLGLPQSALKSKAKMFASALGHDSVYVKLAALRWLQERPGVAKSCLSAIAGLLDNADEWVRLEAIHTIEKTASPPREVAVKVSSLLADSDVEVRKAAAKATGKLFSKGIKESTEVLSSLHAAAKDQD